jgi:hypothetical protein
MKVLENTFTTLHSKEEEGIS